MPFRFFLFSIGLFLMFFFTTLQIIKFSWIEKTTKLVLSHYLFVWNIRLEYALIIFIYTYGTGNKIQFTHNIYKIICAHVFFTLLLQARHLMSEFPPNCVQNAGKDRCTYTNTILQTYKNKHLVEWDKRRLSYLLYLLQEDIKLARKHYKKLASMLSSLTPCEGGMKTVAAVPHLKELLEVRRKSGMKEKARYAIAADCG